MYDGKFLFCAYIKCVLSLYSVLRTLFLPQRVLLRAVRNWTGLAVYGESDACHCRLCRRL